MSGRQRPSGRAELLLRAAFLLSLLLPPAPPGGDELDDLKVKLRSSDKWVRLAAVENLAKHETEEAWELIVEALADPKGEVADTAQLVLAGLEDPELLDCLAFRDGLGSKEPLVRARVAEVLGRLALDPPPKMLLRALDDEDPEVRRMGAWSLERLARSGRIPMEARKAALSALAGRAERDREALVRARALFALAALDPEASGAALDRARREREPLVRGAAAALLPEALDPAAAVAGLAPLAADPVLSVRTVAAEALARLGTRAAAAVLTERLEKETQERLLLTLIEHLQGLSGLKHRRDVRPWRDWLASLPADWRGGRARASEPAVDPGARTVALAGLPILSKRVAILIDLSGSIWNVRPDGKTRKEVVDEELRQTLEGLASDTRFNLIPYTGKPIPWQEKLVPATPANVRAAASWFERCKESGSGNFWDAALLALSDPEVDTIVVLFDGAPTGGTRHRLELLIPLFLELDAARRVAVDVILVDSSKRLQRFWGELARGTGGRLVAVEL